MHVSKDTVTGVLEEALMRIRGLGFGCLHQRLGRIRADIENPHIGIPRHLNPITPTGPRWFLDFFS